MVISGQNRPNLLRFVSETALRWELLDQSGTVVGQLAGSFEAPAGMECSFATVLAIVTWDRERSEPEYRDGLRCDSWEVVVPELIFEPEP